MDFVSKKQKTVILNYHEADIILKGLSALTQLGPWWHLTEQTRNTLLPRDIEHDKKVRKEAELLIKGFENICYEFCYEEE